MPRWLQARLTKGYYQKLKDYDAADWRWELERINARFWRLDRRMGRVDFPNWSTNLRGLVPAYDGTPPVWVLALGEKPEGLRSSRLISLAVDLTVSDQLLVKHFRDVVRQQRVALGVPSPTRVRGRRPAGMPNDAVGPVQFKVWIANRIVELADIYFWAEFRRIPIKKAAIASWLFAADLARPPKRVTEAMEVLLDALALARQLWAQSLLTPKKGP
jgi:hypothetical protein